MATTKLSLLKRRIQMKVDDILPVVGDGENWAASAEDFAKFVGPYVPLSEELIEAAQKASDAAYQAGQSAAEAATSTAAIGNGTSDDAGDLSGDEFLPASRGAGLLQTTLSKIATFVLSIFAILIASGTGAVARSIIAMLRDMPVTPKDFGAKGDGVADDSEPVATWIAAVKELGLKGAVPKGKYRCPAGIFIDLSGYERLGFVIEGAGSQRAIFDVTGAPNTAPQFTVIDSSGHTGGDIFYPVFRDIGIQGSSSDTVAMFGSRDYSDALNSMILENVLFANSSTAAGCAAVEFNYVCAAKLNVVANCGGSSSGGDAIRCRQLQFCTLTGSAGNATNALRMTGGYSFGNVITALDMEEVAYCLAIDVATAARNTFIGGQWSWSVAPYNCIAGGNNRIINPNPASGSFDSVNKTGLVFDFPESTGTWTPSFTASTNPSCTFATQAGYYVKRGRIVTITCRIALSAVSGGSGTVSISGLPFTTTNKADARGAASVGWCNGVTVSGQVALTYSPNSNSLALVQMNNGASSFLTAAALSGSTDMRFTLTYETDAI